VSAVEKGRLPKTDSRLRPDQRAVEQLDLDRAEQIKAMLEEKQRERRKEMDDMGTEWIPRWFTRVEGGEEEDWRLKTGKDSYWECRSRSEWDGVKGVFES